MCLMYKESDFDLAGFCVGIAEKDDLIELKELVLEIF